MLRRNVCTASKENHVFGNTTEGKQTFRYVTE
jgi:hypothetical protein